MLQRRFLGAGTFFVAAVLAAVFSFAHFDRSGVEVVEAGPPAQRGRTTPTATPTPTPALGVSALQNSGRGTPKSPVGVGDSLSVRLGGFDLRDLTKSRVWLYLWSSTDASASFPGCSEVGTDDFLLGESSLVQGNIQASFTVDVDVPPFAGGDNNHFCAVQLGGASATLQVSVEVYPDVYRMALSIDSIASAGVGAAGTLVPGNELSSSFRVTGGRGLTELSDDVTQSRGVPQQGRVRQTDLVTTTASWKACPLRGNLNVGCEWVDMQGISSSFPQGGTHLVPGGDMLLRLSLPSNSVAAERFVVYWGPVDIWYLGVDRGTVPLDRAQDFVVHYEHLQPLESELNSQLVQLEPGDSVDLPISRGSADARGHTFVSMVSCNDNYLGNLYAGGSAPLGSEVALRLLGMQDCTKQRGPAFGDYGTNMPPVSGGVPDLSEHQLRSAWVQHDVTAGYQMVCEMQPIVTSTWVVGPGGVGGAWKDFSYNAPRCWNPVPTDPLFGAPLHVDDPYQCYVDLSRRYRWDEPGYQSTVVVARQAPVAANPGANPPTPAVPAVAGIKRLHPVTYSCGWEPPYFKGEWALDVPLQPTKFKVTGIGITYSGGLFSIPLSWDAVAGATDYEIRRVAVNGSSATGWGTVPFGSGRQLQTTFTARVPLALAGQHQLQVRAVGAAGAGVYSAVLVGLSPSVSTSTPLVVGVAGQAPRGYHLPWYTTKYNAARSFYSFALKWERGGASTGAGSVAARCCCRTTLLVTALSSAGFLTLRSGGAARCSSPAAPCSLAMIPLT